MYALLYTSAAKSQACLRADRLTCAFGWTLEVVSFSSEYLTNFEQIKITFYRSSPVGYRNVGVCIAWYEVLIYFHVIQTP